MVEPILKTKITLPALKPALVTRQRLISTLNKGLQSKLILVSAPAGFGKTTAVQLWAAQLQTLGGEATPPVKGIAWLSLDERDSDPKRFLTYLIAALKAMDGDGGISQMGESALGLLQSPQPVSPLSIHTALINDMVGLPADTLLVLDDTHRIQGGPIHQILNFLLENLPPQVHVLIATREDPPLPLARLRGRGELSEIRAADLRFTPHEAADFLNNSMGLTLSIEAVVALEKRTEGWIAGLQMAGLSMQGMEDTTQFIDSFTGSHRFILDYLLEEVLQKQPPGIQEFLLKTAILGRLTGPLCDALLFDDGDAGPHGTGREVLASLEAANLFITPLDHQRRWYRYHPLFADLLQGRLHQALGWRDGFVHLTLAELHRRASRWFEESGYLMEAFQHAAASGDFDRTADLVEGDGLPLHFRGNARSVLEWLASLPEERMDSRPALWVMFASALSMTGQLVEVEGKLQAAESVLGEGSMDPKIRNLVGHIAAIRALLAAARHQVPEIIAQSKLALENLHPDNLAVRTATIWKMGIAYAFQGDRARAREAYQDAIEISEQTGNTVIQISAEIGLADVLCMNHRLHQAVETYQHVLEIAGDLYLPGTSMAHLGLARIYYAWNDLEAAKEHALVSLDYFRKLETSAYLKACETIWARLLLAEGDAPEAAGILAEAGTKISESSSLYLWEGFVTVQVRVFLEMGDLNRAEGIAATEGQPTDLARVLLARGNPAGALSLLTPFRKAMRERGWVDFHFSCLLLHALAYQALEETNQALESLRSALHHAAREGLVRPFLDEGAPMGALCSAASKEGILPQFVGALLTAFEAEGIWMEPQTGRTQGGDLIDPLSERELEVLALIAQGFTNQEIGDHLFIALSTVKGHNRRIYGKLNVKNRTEAVARARDLGIIQT
jgi:LuxR family transcriptional regulator, maltose regulon positive regulatory protein